ncbi:MbtH family protein [Mycobacterium sp. NPDC003449]
MSTSPFDDEDGQFFVLSNAELQHSLWPAFSAVPGGWHIVHGGPGGVSRQSCMEFVDANWTDMRPKSLQDAMSGDLADK